MPFYVDKSTEYREYDERTSNSIFFVVCSFIIENINRGKVFLIITWRKQRFLLNVFQSVQRETDKVHIYTSNGISRGHFSLLRCSHLFFSKFLLPLPIYSLQSTPYQLHRDVNYFRSMCLTDQRNVNDVQPLSHRSSENEKMLTTTLREIREKILLQEHGKIASAQLFLW